MTGGGTRGGSSPTQTTQWCGYCITTRAISLLQDPLATNLRQNLNFLSFRIRTERVFLQPVSHQTVRRCPVKEGNKITKWLMFMVWFPTRSCSPPGAFVGKKRFGVLFGFLNRVSESPFVVTYLLKEFSGVYFSPLTFLEYTSSLLSHRSCFPVGPHTPNGLSASISPTGMSLDPFLAFPCPCLPLSLPSLGHEGSQLISPTSLVKAKLWSKKSCGFPNIQLCSTRFSSLGIPRCAFPSKLCVQQDRGVLCWGSTGWAHPPVLAPGSWEGFPASAPPAMRCWGTALGY